VNVEPQRVDVVVGDFARRLQGLPLRTDEQIRAEVLQENRETIRQRSRVFASRLLPWAGARRPEWRERVKEPRLRALAERYELSRGSVLVVGPTGVGKTLTAMAVARGLLAAAYRTGDVDALIVRAAWATGPELARALRETRLGSASEALAEARRTPVLFLDELGQENAPAGWLLELLDDRYRRSTPTFTASGLTLRELEARYGSGAVRRLKEPVGDTLDLFTGQA